ncbi:MAG: hypothetical protein JNK45_12730 [Myxococcales bacterium]|nr:hypothetical protein [Myxococcales bacterium]
MRPSITIPLCAALLAVACTSHEPPDREAPPVVEAKAPPTPEPKPQPKPEPPPPKLLQLVGTISSVSFVEDCPDTAPSAAPTSLTPAPMPSGLAPGAPITPKRERAAGDTAHGMWSPPCRQSTVQLSLAHDGDIAQRLAIQAARLVDADTGAPLGTIAVRGPTRWDATSSAYVAWDELLPAGPGIMASYKLGAPAGRLVSRAVLELDVRFDGRTITLRSPEFQHEPPHVIVT